jgi:hypothetical protein
MISTFLQYCLDEGHARRDLARTFLAMAGSGSFVSAADLEAFPLA